MWPELFRFGKVEKRAYVRACARIHTYVVVCCFLLFIFVCVSLCLVSCFNYPSPSVLTCVRA